MVIRRDVNPIFYAWYKNHIPEIMDRDEFDNLQAAFVAGIESNLTPTAPDWPAACDKCGGKMGPLGTNCFDCGWKPASR